MKALKTVAVALGITLGALIVIPLAVLAGLVRLAEADRGGRRGDPRAGPGGRLIPDDPLPARATPAGPAGVGLSGTVRRRADARRPRRDRPATAVSPSSASSSSWSSGPATSSWSRARSVSCRRSASRSFATALASTLLLLLLRWREGSLRLPRGDIAPDRPARGHRVRLLPDPLDGRAPDDPGRRLGTADRRDARHDRPARDGDRCRHAEPGQARRRARLFRRRRPGHRRRAGTRPRRLARRGPADSGARPRAGRSTRSFGARHPATALAARHDDLGARGRDAVHGAGRDRPARHGATCPTIGPAVLFAISLCGRRSRRVRERRRPPRA